MDLSIVVASYNTKKLTIQCIKSVLKEGSSLKKELIVVDNGSTDGSLDSLRKLAKPEKSVSITENETNLGFSRANNQGINTARGRYILLLNSDTQVKQGSLGKLVEFARKTKDAGVIGARLLNGDGSVQPSCFNFPTIRRAIDQYWFGTDTALDKYFPKGSKPVVVDAVVGAAFLMTPKALRMVGGLDEKYFFFYEDMAYCREVSKVGLKVYYFPHSEIFHYHGASGERVVENQNQWRRLIPSSKIYHGTIRHYLFNFIIWSGQKWKKFIRS